VKRISDGQGLGLWSMQERVRLAAGRFEIHSDTQKGTLIDVWTPLKVESDGSESEPAGESFGASAVTSGHGTA